MPSCLACASSVSNSLPTAPEIAPTLDIALVKALPSSTAALPKAIKPATATPPAKAPTETKAAPAFAKELEAPLVACLVFLFI